MRRGTQGTASVQQALPVTPTAQVTIPEGTPIRGDASLLLSYTPPRTAARGAAGVIDTLPEVALPLHVSAGPLARYAVAAEAAAASNSEHPADGVKVSPGEGPRQVASLP